MSEASNYWASGNWKVSEGKEDEFVDRWTAFLTWTKEANEGFLFARLIRDLGNPGHYVSFASWHDVEAMKAWQDKPEFAEYFGGCRALCEDMQGGGFSLARAVDA
ncbi:antibiotic biosynthesis monooxygenase family protein [Streptomyces sp. NPDC048337]|uniref:antibiotic biosynthesis monooxygenase family protein n=1 Tax=Streptomyces sp. NPDC048337 TaxID=3365535 RepID=UPI0037220685